MNPNGEKEALVRIVLATIIALGLCTAMAVRAASAQAASTGAAAAEPDFSGLWNRVGHLWLDPILDDEGWEIALRAVLADPGIDVGVFGCVPLTGALATVPAGPAHNEDLSRPEAIGGRLARLFAESSKAWVTVIDGGALYDPLARLLSERGVPVFRTMDRAVRVLERYCGWRLGR